MIIIGLSRPTLKAFTRRKYYVYQIYIYKVEKSLIIKKQTSNRNLPHVLNFYLHEPLCRISSGKRFWMLHPNQETNDIYTIYKLSIQLVIQILIDIRRLYINNNFQNMSQLDLKYQIAETHPYLEAHKSNQRTRSEIDLLERMDLESARFLFYHKN